MDLSLLETMVREFQYRENIGDRAYFEARLAAHMSMRRSGGAIVDRARFLSDTQPGGDREIVAMLGIRLLGGQRACVNFRGRSGGKVVDNFLVFVRQADAPEGWVVLAWANEPA